MKPATADSMLDRAARVSTLMHAEMVRAYLPAAPVQRSESGTDALVPNVDLDVPLHMAKAAIGLALRRTIARTQSVLKDFGDPSHVKRVCDGDIPNVIARAWVRPDTRREFVLALAEASGLYDVDTTISSRRQA